MGLAHLHLQSLQRAARDGSALDMIWAPAREPCKGTTRRDRGGGGDNGKRRQKMQALGGCCRRRASTRDYTHGHSPTKLNGAITSSKAREKTRKDSRGKARQPQTTEPEPTQLEELKTRPNAGRTQRQKPQRIMYAISEDTTNP